MLESKQAHAQTDFQTVPEGAKAEFCYADPRTNSIVHAFDSIWVRLSPYFPTDLVFDSFSRYATSKQNLTVLSAHIHVYTQLAEPFDPENCIGALNEYFEIAAESVFEFYGQVDKFQGYGFNAIFTGICEGETHARRAVRCALRLREVARKLDLPKLPGQRIPLGIGINTGLAAMASPECTAIGDVVNVARHLQRISEPHQIIVSAHTQRRMGDDVKCEALKYVRVRRRINRIEAFLVS